MKGADVIVVGLGAMGSATAYQLAKRGASVIGIDQFDPPHVFGSSHGDSRVTRQATGEGDAYVPLAIRSQQLWREIEAETGNDIFTACGVLMLRPSAEVSARHGVENRVLSASTIATRFGIDHEVLGGSEAKRRFPAFEVDDDWSAYFEPGGGFVCPETAVESQLTLARRYGAVLHCNEQVRNIRRVGNGVEVETLNDRFTAANVVVSAGAWVQRFLTGSQWKSKFKIYRQSLHWFAVDQARASELSPDNCPVFMWSTGIELTESFYGFPMINGVSGGVKVATAAPQDEADIDTVDGNIDDEVAVRMYDRFVNGRLPGVLPEHLKSVGCLYTVTPDGGFVIDDHPEIEGVTVVSPCSGHGFKHSAAIGESVAQRLLDGESKIDLGGFSFSRLNN